MNTNPNPESKVVKIKKSGVMGVLMFLLLIIAISAVAFIVYLRSAGYDFSSMSLKDAISYLKASHNTAKSSSEQINFSQDGSVDCQVYGKYTIVLSQDGIKWYDRNGKLQHENALTLTKPVLRISDKYMAVIDISGRDIFFYKGVTQLWTKKMDNQIINAEISNDGYCTVVTQSKEFKSAVQVIDLNGADRYTKLCAEDIVLSARSIHNGEDVLINKLVTDTVKTGTKLEYNNIYEEKPFASVVISDAIMPVLLSQGDNEVAVGQNLILAMDKQGKEVWRKKAGSIFCVAPDGGKYVIAAGKFTDANGFDKQKILVLNKEGKEAYSFEQPENILGMRLYGSRLLLRTQRSIYIYSLKGKKLGQYSTRNEIKDAYLVENDKAVIISGGTISTVRIDNNK